MQAMLVESDEAYERDMVRALFAQPIEDYWEDARVLECISYLRTNKHLKLPLYWPSEW